MMGVVFLYVTEYDSNGVNGGGVKFSGARHVVSACGHVSTITVT
jgi:hypothetical protein